MKKIFPALLLFFIPFYLLSQPITLEWTDNKVIYAGEEALEVLAFEGAQYDGSHMPYYLYSEKISTEEAENYEYDFSISDAVFSPINTDLAFDTAFLKDDFQVDGKVSHSRNSSYLEINVIPFKWLDNTLYRLESFQINISKHPIIKLKSATTWFADNSVLATGNWYKLGVKEDGIYKLTYSQLESMNIDPSNVSVFTTTNGNLSSLISDYVDDWKEIAIYDGGDYILFYAQGPNTWTYNSSTTYFEHDQHLFWNENYYFITSDVGEAKRLKARTEPTGTSTQTYTTFVDYDFIENEENTIAKSGREWFGDKLLNGYSDTHTFYFDNVVEETAIVRTKVAAVSYSKSNTMSVYVDGNLKENISLSYVSSAGTTNLASVKSATYSFIPSGNSIEVTASFSSQESTANGYVDYFAVELKRELKLVDGTLLFRNKPTGDDIVTYQVENSSSNTLIWDVSNAYDVRTVSTTLDGSSLSFDAPGNELREYVAFNPSASLPSPSLKGKVDNQNLHAVDVPDMVILTIDDFMSVAEDLADLHREEDGMDVLIVKQDEIFNEFSGAKADVTAIRWFMKMLYDRSPEKFKYLLILGDGSVNNRMYESGVTYEPSLLMTYQSIESIYGSSTYVSDDYFGLLDDSEGNPTVTNSTTGETYIEKYDKVDIGIGRIPINSVSEGEDVLDKIITYKDNTKRTIWKNRVCFVADDEDNNIHVSDADKLAEKVRSENPGIAVKKVYLDAFEQVKVSTGQSYPDAKALSDQYLSEGTLIWSYTGHGSPVALSGEKMMYISDIEEMTNLANLPLWVTATCDFCPYDHNDEFSAGEAVLLNPIGGGIALFTTTRLVYSSSNYLITNNFYSYILNSDADGNKLRLGDVARLTKQATGTSANKRKFALIGDPALQLNLPDAKWNVQTDSINGEDIALFTDTLESLSTMTVSGHVTTSDGSVDTDFNGILYPIIYDKISELTTLGNDDDSEPMDFLMWNSVLYSGKTSVENGRFEFSFILPKDMDYTSGNGRIEYYASSEEAEANGYYEDFYLGGFNDDYTLDTIGPLIDLYLNSTDFEDGGTVNPNPMLIAQVSDMSGINTSGNAIGHDITVMLDDDPNTLEIINTSYTTEVGDYTKGTVMYTLSDLEEGEHNLTFTIWDMQNNSSSAQIDFVVKNDALPTLSSVYSYPNPASLSSGEKVLFVAEHDRPDQTLTVNLHIFDSSGRIIYQTSEYSYSASNEIYFYWQPSETNLLPGLYFYRMSIDDGTEVSVGKSKKLLLKD